jgi:hypothetical protein
VLGELDRAMRVDERPFGHHAVGGDRAGVDPSAVGQPRDPVEARDRRQLNLLAGVVLSLTADGRLINDVHSRMHDEMKDGVADFLSRYSNAELSVLSKMLRDLLDTEKVGVRIAVRE